MCNYVHIKHSQAPGSTRTAESNDDSTDKTVRIWPWFTGLLISMYAAFRTWMFTVSFCPPITCRCQIHLPRTLMYSSAQTFVLRSRCEQPNDVVERYAGVALFLSRDQIIHHPSSTTTTNKQVRVQTSILNNEIAEQRRDSADEHTTTPYTDDSPRHRTWSENSGVLDDNKVTLKCAISYDDNNNDTTKSQGRQRLSFVPATLDDRVVSYLIRDKEILCVQQAQHTPYCNSIRSCWTTIRFIMFHEARREGHILSTSA